MGVIQIRIHLTIAQDEEGLDVGWQVERQRRDDETDWDVIATGSELSPQLAAQKAGEFLAGEFPRLYPSS